MEAVLARTPGVPPRRTNTHSMRPYAPSGTRRTGLFARVPGLRNEKLKASFLLTNSSTPLRSTGACALPVTHVTQGKDSIMTDLESAATSAPDARKQVLATLVKELEAISADPKGPGPLARSLRHP
jgi:hypothetical protein